MTPPGSGCAEVGLMQGGRPGPLISPRVCRGGGRSVTEGLELPVRAETPKEAAAFISFLPLLGVRFPWLTSHEQSRKTFFYCWAGFPV